MCPPEDRTSVKGMEIWKLFTKLDKEKCGLGVGRDIREEEQKLLFLRSSLFLTQGHFSIYIAK